MAEQTETAFDDIEHARRLLQTARQEGAGSGPFADALDSIDEAIRLARRLNHPRFPTDPSRSDAQTHELIGESRNLGRVLLQTAAAKAAHLSLSILRGSERTPAEVLRLAKLLDRLDEFAMARRILDRARSHPDFLKDKALSTQIIQKRALYTYKD